MNKTVYLILLFVFLLFLQIFVLNNINFLGYINPFLYIAFVFYFPLKENKFPILFFSFLLGLIIDFFSDSGGIHALSIITIAYLRLFFVRVFFKKLPSDYSFFNLQTEAFGKVFNYIVTLTIIHHFILFAFINFSFQNFTSVLTNTLFSSVFTLVLFFLANYIFTKEQ
ncbi:rod shape-determining protein MreD [Polaribacter sargassicola]|uniref:rod shape-determining protein MreD n=1 Tax=Polaribacter sargassicola TaxID=2836891 RepID=UPI001F013F95|nr:rod shape-determining protein MreD [Polaribacter sp. DS7-9]MCG1035904.1 rod shape-determining protein MreD [Polaribacter sp. DS7-9]